MLFTSVVSPLKRQEIHANPIVWIAGDLVLEYALNRIGYGPGSTATKEDYDNFKGQIWNKMSAQEKAQLKWNNSNFTKNPKKAGWGKYALAVSVLSSIATLAGDTMEELGTPQQTTKPAEDVYSDYVELPSGWSGTELVKEPYNSSWNEWKLDIPGKSFNVNVGMYSTDVTHDDFDLIEFRGFRPSGSDNSYGWYDYGGEVYLNGNLETNYSIQSVEDRLDGMPNYDNSIDDYPHIIGSVETVVPEGSIDYQDPGIDLEEIEREYGSDAPIEIEMPDVTNPDNIEVDEDYNKSPPDEITSPEPGESYPDYEGDYGEENPYPELDPEPDSNPGEEPGGDTDGFWNTLFDWLQQLLDWLQQIWEKIQEILDFLTQILKQLIEQIISIIQSILETLGNVWDWLINVLETLLNQLVTIVTDIFGTLESVYTWLVETLGSLIGDLISGLNSILDFLIGNLTEFLSDILSGINSIIDFLNGLVTNIVGAFETAFLTWVVPSADYFPNHFSSIRTGLAEKFPDINKIPDFITSFNDSACSQLENQTITVFGVTAEILKWDYVIEASNWWKPIISSFIWLLIVAYGYRKVSAIIAGRGGV